MLRILFLLMLPVLLYSYMNEELIQNHITAMQLICQTKYRNALIYISISKYMDKIHNKKDYIILQNELRLISYRCNYHDFRNYLINLNKK